jgi:hypothetical protein
VEHVRLPLPSLLLRWLVGMGLVFWRYLWLTTPLHRWERRESRPAVPPELPGGLDRDRLLPWTAGVGSLYHRRFRVRIAGASTDAAGLMAAVGEDFGRFVPREVVRVHEPDSEGRRLRVNDELVVDMPGPWNGPVRVAEVGPHHLRLATLAGHLEAGQVEFRAYDEPGLLVFEVETWARSATRTVHLLYTYLGLAKEVQLNMWLRFCQAAARRSGGRARGGVEIGTVVTPVPPAQPPQ